MVTIEMKFLGNASEWHSAELVGQPGYGRGEGTLTRGVQEPGGRWLVELATSMGSLVQLL